MKKEKRHWFAQKGQPLGLTRRRTIERRAWGEVTRIAEVSGFIRKSQLRDRIRLNNDGCQFPMGKMPTHVTVQGEDAWFISQDSEDSIRLPGDDKRITTQWIGRVEKGRGKGCVLVCRQCTGASRNDEEWFPMKMEWVIYGRILIVDNNVSPAALREHGVRDRRVIQREALAQLQEHRVVYIILERHIVEEKGKDWHFICIQ